MNKAKSTKSIQQSLNNKPIETSADSSSSTELSDKIINIQTPRIKSISILTQHSYIINDNPNSSSIYFDTQSIKNLSNNITDVLCTAHHTGHLSFFSMKNKCLIKMIKISDAPLRTVSFNRIKINKEYKNKNNKDLNNNKNPVNIVRINSTHLATAGDDKNIYIIDASTFNVTRVIKNAHSDYIRSLQFHAYLPYIVSCSDDMKVRVFNYLNGKKIKSFYGHTSYVMHVDLFNSDLNNNLKHDRYSNKIISAGLDSCLRIYRCKEFTNNLSTDNIKDYDTVDIIQAHFKGINTIKIFYTKNGYKLLTGSDDGLVKLFVFNNNNDDIPTVCKTFDFHNVKSVNAVEVIDENEKIVLVSGGEDGCVVFVNLSDGMLLKKIDLNRMEVFNAKHNRVWSIKWNGEHVYVGTDYGLHIININDIL